MPIPGHFFYDYLNGNWELGDDLNDDGWRNHRLFKSILSLVKDSKKNIYYLPYNPLFGDICYYVPASKENESSVIHAWMKIAEDSIGPC